MKPRGSVRLPLRTSWSSFQNGITAMRRTEKVPVPPETRYRRGKVWVPGVRLVTRNEAPQRMPPLNEWLMDDMSEAATVVAPEISNATPDRVGRRPGVLLQLG